MTMYIYLISFYLNVTLKKKNNVYLSCLLHSLRFTSKYKWLLDNNDQKYRVKIPPIFLEQM